MAAEFIEVDNQKALFSVKLLDDRLSCATVGGPKIQQCRLPAGSEEQILRAGDMQGQKKGIRTSLLSQQNEGDVSRRRRNRAKTLTWRRSGRIRAKCGWRFQLHLHVVLMEHAMKKTKSWDFSTVCLRGHVSTDAWLKRFFSKPRSLCCVRLCDGEFQRRYVVPLKQELKNKERMTVMNVCARVVCICRNSQRRHGRPHGMPS